MGSYSVKSLTQFPASHPSEGKAPGWEMEIDEIKLRNRIEQTHHQLLLRCCFEGFLFGGAPELPHANVAGAKLEIVLFFLFLSLSVHATSAPAEHRRG